MGKENAHPRTHMMQVVFSVVIVYAVSSIAILGINRDIVPHFLHISFTPRLLIIFTVIAFGTMEFISIFHLSTMLRRKKRKTDQHMKGQVEGLYEILAASNPLSRLLFIVVILYALCALVFIVLIFGKVPRFTYMHFNSDVSIAFAIVSFGLTVCISAYHLSTMIRRRKRKTDKM